MPVRNDIIILDRFDLTVAQTRIVPVGPYVRMNVQAANRYGVTWASAVITITHSISGIDGDDSAFAPGKTISAAGETANIDITDEAFVHFETTTTESASGEVQLYLYLTDIGA